MILFKFWIFKLLKVDKYYVVAIGNFVITHGDIFNNTLCPLIIAYKKEPIIFFRKSNYTPMCRGAADLGGFLSYSPGIMLRLNHRRLTNRIGFTGNICLGFTIDTLYYGDYISRRIYISIPFFAILVFKWKLDIHKYVKPGMKLKYVTYISYMPEYIKIIEIKGDKTSVIGDGQLTEIDTFELCNYNKI